MYDIASMININLFCVIPTQGLLFSDEFMESQFYLKVSMFIFYDDRGAYSILLL